MKRIILPILLTLLLTGCGEKAPEVELSAVVIPASGDTAPTETGSEGDNGDLPAEESTEAKEDPYAELSGRVRKYMDRLTPYEKVCQMFIITPEALPGYDYLNYMDDWTRTTYADYPVGGFVYFTKNILYTDQIKNLLSDTKEMASAKGVGPFLSVDEEGGTLTRVNAMLGCCYTDNMSYYGGLNDVGETCRVGTEIGGYLSEIGFNLDFAPVADVNIDPMNELGVRIFSSDPTIVSDMTAAFVRGLHSKNVGGTLKHFPGLGAGNGNTHYDSVYIDRTLEQLQCEEFLAFRGGISEGCEFVMVGHQIVSAAAEIDGEELPADLSPTVVGWLRNELGFKGVAVTDSQAMGAIANKYTSSEAAIMAVEAGMDVILMPADARGAIDGLMQAVNSGRISFARIDESAARILAAKDKLGLLE